MEPDNNIITNDVDLNLGQQDPLTISAVAPDLDRESNISVKDTNDFISGGIFDTPDLQERKAKAQSWGSKFGGFLAQSGAEIVGGTIEGLGSMYELIENTIVEAANGDADFDNLLIEVGRGIRESTADAFPILRKNPEKAIDFNDWGYIFEGGKSVFSTLSFLIPARTATGAMSFVGKLANLTDKISDTGKFLMKTGVTAAVMRNAENMRESFDVYNQTQQAAFEELKDEKRFNEWLLSEAGQEYLDEIGGRDISPSNASEWIGSKAGWHTYKWNSANIVFDLVQSAALFRGVGKMTRTNAAGGKMKIREAAGLETSVLKRTNKAFNPILGTFSGQITEGIEEAVNFIGGEEGRYFGNVLIDSDRDDKSLTNRLADYVKDPHLWNSFLWGVVGGAAFQGVANLSTRKQRRQQDLNKLEEIQNRSVFIKDFADKKQQIINKYKAGELTEEQVQEGIDDLTSSVGYHLGMTASRYGNVDNLLEAIESENFQESLLKNYNPSEIGNFVVSQKELVDSVKSNILKAEKQYQNFQRKLFTSPASQAAKEMLVATQMTTASEIARHEKAIERLEKKEKELMDDLRDNSNISEHPNFQLGLDITAFKMAQMAYQTLAEKGQFPKEYQDKVNQRGQKLKDKLGELISSKDEAGLPDLSNINPELIETKAALILRDAYKSVNKDVADSLNDKNLLKEIDNELQERNKEAKKEKAENLKEELKNKTANGTTTKEELEEIAKKEEEKGNKEAAKVAEEAKKQIEENEKAGSSPLKGNVSEQPIVFETDEAKVNDAKKVLGPAYAMFKNNFDSAQTVEQLNSLRSRLLSSEKIKANGLTENSGAIALIDDKIKAINEANSIEVDENTEEQVKEEAEKEVVESELSQDNLEDVEDTNEEEKDNTIQTTEQEILKTDVVPVTDQQDVNFGEVNLFVLPLSFVEPIVVEEQIIDYKIRQENLEEAKLIYEGGLDGEIELRIDTQNSYHKDNLESSAIEVYKDGKRTKIYLNTLESINKSINAVKKIQEKKSKGEKLGVVFYPELGRKIDEIAWSNPTWLQKLNIQLDNTKKLREQVWNNKEKTIKAKLNVNSPGSVLNNSKFVPANKLFNENTELFFTHPDATTGGIEIMGSNGSNFIKSINNNTFNPGRIYAMVNGLNGDPIPVRLKVSTLKTKDVDTVFNLILKLANLMQTKSLSLNDAEVDRIREQLENILVVNKFNSDTNTYFKIHQNKIEFTFGTNRQHKVFINWRVSANGKQFNVPKSGGKNDLFIIYKLDNGKKVVETPYFSRASEKHTAAIKKALSQKLYAVDKMKLISSDAYVKEIINNRLLTDVGSVKDAEGNVLGHVVLKQDGRPENAIFSLTPLDESSQKSAEKTEEVQTQQIDTGLNTNTDDILLFNVNAASVEFEIGTEQERRANWERLFGTNIPLDTNIHNLIQVGGELAYGVFRNAAAEVSSLAPKGTEYHEAFHVVSQLYLSENQRNALYNSERKEGETDLQVEERLAEQFRMYALQRDANITPKGFSANVQKFFERIYNYIKNLLGYPTSYIFDKAYSGGFNYKSTDRQIEYAKKVQLLSAAPSDIELSFTRRDINTFTDILTRFAGEFFIRNPKLTKQDIINDPNLDVKNYVKNLVTDVANNPTKWGITEGQSKELQRRLNYFDGFWNLAKEKLESSLNIKIDYDGEVAEEGEQLQKDWDDTKAFSRSGKESFSSELKLMLMTIPKIGSYDIESGKYNFKTKKDAEIGIAPSLDFNTVYPYLQRLMSGSLDINEMMARLEQAGQHDPSLIYLKQKLDGNENLKNAWFFNFNKPLTNFHNYQITGLGNKINVRFDRSNKQNTHFRFSNQWAEIIKTKIDNGLYTEQIKIHVDNLRKQLGNSKANGDTNSMYDISSQLLDILGVSISSSVIKKMVENDININNHRSVIPSYRETIELPLNNILNKVFPSKGESEFSNIGDLNKLAKEFQFFTYDSLENSFMNTDGSIMFGFNNPNFINNFFKDIEAVKNPHYVNKEQAQNNLLNKLKEYGSDPSFKYSNWLWDTGDGKGMLKTIEGKKDITKVTIANLNLPYIQNMNLFTFDGLKNRVSGEGKRYADMHDNDWLLTNVLDYVSSDPNKNFTTIPSIIPADSGNSHAVRVPLFRYLNEDSIKVNGYIFEKVKNIFRQEVLRMKTAADLMFERDIDDSLKVKEGLDIRTLETKYHYNGELIEDGRPTGNVFKFQFLDYTNESGEIVSLNDIPGLTWNGVINLLENNGLSSEMQSKVNTHIEAFIKFEINETKRAFNPIRDTVLSMQVNDKPLLDSYSNSWNNFISEFAVNNYITNVEQFNWFIGSVAEYKNAIETNKRAKGPFSPMIGPNLNSIGETYQGVILKDIYLQSAVLDGITKGLKSRRLPDEQVTNITKHYQNINTTDAQGYATLGRYEKILRSYGRMFDETIKLIEKIKNGEEIKNNEFSILFQPLKPFYYGRTFDKNTKSMVTRLVKLSIIPMIPSLIKGSQMELLNNWAVENNVDEIYFESAVKVGQKDVVQITDNNGQLKPNFGSLLTPQTFYNKFWGLQLDVPSHTKDTQNKLGVQIAKILPSGLSESKEYELDGKKITGKELTQEWHNVLGEHIHQEALSLLKRLKATKIDGKWTIDPNSAEIQEILLQELKSRNLAENYKEALKYNIKGEFNMPLFYSALSAKFESLLSSLFSNNVTDLKTPGSHMVLGSTAFLNKVGEDSGIEWSKEILDRNDFRLRSGVIENDKITYGEVLMPRWTKQFFNEDGTLIPIDEIPEKALTFITNRIPTEWKHSIIALKAVGFLPEGMDSLMIAPDDLVAMMGSDFDVDSGYNWHYNLKDGQVIEYDSEKSSSQNSKAARENRLLDVAISIMTSPATFVEKYTPSSFEDMTKAKKDVDEIRGINNSNLDPASVRVQAGFRKAVIAGRALKGLSASYNGILPVFNDIEARFTDQEVIDGTLVKKTYSGFTVKYDKNTLDTEQVRERYGDDIVREDEKTITINHRFIGNSPIKDGLNIDGTKLSWYNSQVLANILDIVKEGIPHNLNTYTYGVFQSLLAVGSNMEYASRFIGQPIIDYLIHSVNENEGINSTDNSNPVMKTRTRYQTELFKLRVQSGSISDKTLERKFIQKLTFKEKNDFGVETGRIIWDNNKQIYVTKEEVEAVLGYNPYNREFYTTKELESLMSPNLPFKGKRLQDLSEPELKAKEQYLVKQLYVLDNFALYRNAANDISNNMRIMSFDKVASAPNLGVTPEFRTKLEGFNSEIEDAQGRNVADSIYGEESTYPVLKSYWENSNQTAYDLFSSLFIKYSPGFMRGQANLNMEGIFDENVIKKFHNHMLANYMSKIPFFAESDQERILGINTDINLDPEMSLEDFKKLSTANKVEVMKSKSFELLYNNPNHILNYLEGKLSNFNQVRNGFHKLDVNKPAPSEQLDDYITDSFRDLYFGTNPFMKDLAEDLIRYSFFNTGLTFGKNSYANYIHVSVLQSGLGLDKELRHMKVLADHAESYDEQMGNYVQNFIQNNWYNKNIVPKVATKYKRVNGSLVTDDFASEESGETVYQTDKFTPYWTIVGDIVTIPSKRFRNESKEVKRSNYLLLTQRIGEENKTTLLKRWNAPYEITEDDNIYFYPVNKLGNNNIIEFSEESFIEGNNVKYPEEIYEEFFAVREVGGQSVSLEQIAENFFNKEKKDQENNNNLKCN